MGELREFFIGGSCLDIYILDFITKLQLLLQICEFRQFPTSGLANEKCVSKGHPYCLRNLPATFHQKIQLLPMIRNFPQFWTHKVSF